MNIEVSASFKKMTTKAIFSIVLFLIVYVLLLLLSVGITILCLIGAFYVITIRPSFITLALGVGLGSLGFFILAFLFKFLFKKHKIDRSHLTEITAESEPKLFRFIETIVQEVGTDFPKKIYVSADVNASVFYDSSFWSMFFPVKKNLQIGLGLVNGISEQEFKAILAHEFGHFSQRSMKVGSYVYYVNQVIFNMLYDNDSFDKMIQKWANISNYFSIFLMISVKIISGIQWVLKKMYEFINVAYLALSREMEFHADELAANVAGITPLQESLLRMDLVDASYNKVLQFYGEKIGNNFKSKNIYEEQVFVMDYLAKEGQLQFKNSLPLVTYLDMSKFNKSKLVIENQWASHPSVEDRCANLDRVSIHKEVENNALAKYIFQDFEKIQEKITNQLFSHVDNDQTFESVAITDFKQEFVQKQQEESFHAMYNGYYDNKNSTYFDTEKVATTDILPGLELLFDKEKVDLVYDCIAILNDEQTIQNIADGLIKLKSFDYDGHKFKSSEASTLLPKLKKEKEALEERIAQNDVTIFNYFRLLAKQEHQEAILIGKYRNFFAFDQSFDISFEYHNKLMDATQFMQVVTPIEQIKPKLLKMYELEKAVKKEIKEMLESSSYAKVLTAEIRASFEAYLKEDYLYFSTDKYIDSELEIFYEAITNYRYMLSRGYFIVKKDLLDFQVQLMATSREAIAK